MILSYSLMKEKCILCIIKACKHFKLKRKHTRGYWLHMLHCGSFVASEGKSSQAKHQHRPNGSWGESTQLYQWHLLLANMMNVCVELIPKEICQEETCQWISSCSLLSACISVLLTFSLIKKPNQEFDCTNCLLVTLQPNPHFSPLSSSHSLLSWLQVENHTKIFPPQTHRFIQMLHLHNSVFT